MNKNTSLNKAYAKLQTYSLGEDQKDVQQRKTIPLQRI
jgi:hypothetical protein